MEIRVEKTPIEDLVIIKNEVFEDARGFFTEVFMKDVFTAAGLPSEFMQLNHSGSAKGVVRGLHFQLDPPMGKLMRITRGSAFLIAGDIRRGSPHLGEWFGIEVEARDRKQIWAPEGFARGFCVLSDYAHIEYLCTGTYNSRGESGIRWNDPEIGIKCPVSDSVLSEKDRAAQTLSEWLASEPSDHFLYE